jgi:hypothetical protein
MKSYFLSAQPIVETHGGSATMFALLREEFPEKPDEILEIHRQPPSQLATRHFRAMSLPALGLLQLLLPFLPFDFVSRFSFALLRHLRSLGPCRAMFNYNQLLIYPLLVRSLTSQIIVHDVLYDMWRSDAGIRRLFWRLVRFWERRFVRWLPENATLVFVSEKDRAMLADGVRCGVRVLDLPQLIAGDSVGRRLPQRQTLALRPGVRVGLLGAWARRENRDGATKFLKALSPEVRNGLQFRIAGLGSEALPDGASITKLGFVEDLSTFFDSIDVFVAPLDRGAGVKIKVLRALEYGVPLYLTEKAMEGITMPAGHPNVVEADCRQLAKRFNCDYVQS